MRGLPFLFLFLFPLLVAAHPAGKGGVNRHQQMSAWHMGSHDGSSPHDFGRSLARGEHLASAARDRIDVQEPRRLNSFDMGNGSRLGVGFVGGRHLGFRFKSPF
jgi:hypothetical protein